VKYNTSGIISTVVAGVGGLAIDGAGNIFVAVRASVQKIDISGGGAITTVAGIVDSFGFSGDGGPATAAKLSEVQDAAFDASGNLYIADGANSRIRMVPRVGVPFPTSTGIPQVARTTDNRISILPNPNKGVFNVACSLNTRTDENASVEVIDMQGLVVYSTTTAAQNGNINTQIKPGGIANGMYLLTITCGTETATTRFVIVK